jgi:hypothetical protein
MVRVSGDEESSGCLVHRACSSCKLVWSLA